MKCFEQYLGNLDAMTTESNGEKIKSYIHPTLKNLGVINVVLLREAVAPVVFRNAEQEITDIEVDGEVYVRAVPNKFKYPEKNRGMQILRAYNVGGRLPQNKTVIGKKQSVSEVYDLNTFVFGDSAMREKNVLPVKSGVNYSDGLSLLPKHQCVDQTFHNRAFEDGTLFDAESKKNSDNLFNRHFITPGTLMVQVLSSQGRLLPPEALDHLLLSIGVAGTYGGQTSVTGTNIRTSIVGVYGAKFERPASSPYEIIKALARYEADLTEPNEAEAAIHQMLSEAYETAMDGKEARDYQTELVSRFENQDPSLEAQYKKAALKVGDLFDNWFGTGKKS
ncbi:type I-D CRISPR-associated protein Cas7/Csc2 [Desulfatibacillum aliphaticivorans]|uniref:type I-D CRISPR-associated protein Cas7/Csc2 n=1 Tax=Desulfatibacillum aliphaticivorans TaxID=218208 RepID=UPI0004139093|nr:type I-D CRISPR-associated protein Cas7/Csc2 [Desulfatibacillum aliphaticivorans]